MTKNEFYNLRPFFRNNPKMGVLTVFIALPFIPLIITILSTKEFFKFLNNVFTDIMESYITIFRYIKYCFNKKLEDN